MVAADLLRLAWEAEHDGRRNLRDSLMTLAIAESGPDDSWAERCRARLVSERAGHYLGDFSSVREALRDPRVIEARDRLRSKYPPYRVDSLLLRAAARRGAFTGRPESLEAMIEDLAGPGAEAENVRRDAPQPSRGPLARLRATRPAAFSLSYPAMSAGPGDFEPEPPSEYLPGMRIDDPAEVDHFYLTVLLTIAILLASAREASSGPRRG